MKYYIRLFFCLNIVLLSSCEKDINLIYHQVDPIYVVEASVTNTKAEDKCHGGQFIKKRHQPGKSHDFL